MVKRLTSHFEFVDVLRLRQRVSSADIVVHYALRQPARQAVPEGVVRSGEDSPASPMPSSAHGRHVPDLPRGRYVTHCLLETDPGERRVGLAVSNSVGHAVVRNRIKRRFRALARAHEDLLPEGCDVILRARRSAADADFASLDAQVASLFSRVAKRLAPQVASSSAPAPSSGASSVSRETTNGC